MKKIFGLMLVAVMLTVAAPAYSARASQVFSCEMEDDATEAQVKAGASKWLEAAKGMKGGANLEAWVYFPVAVDDMGESDVLFVVVSPSFTEWGEFWDGYEGSAAAKIDNANRDFTVCPNSSLWESVQVD